MTKTETLHFTYEPIGLTKMLLQMYLENHLEKTLESDANKYACYEYLKVVTDEKMESLLGVFVKKENIDVITFEDWKYDAHSVFECIFETNEYKSLELEYKRRGHSKTKMGVIDKTDSTFYGCTLAMHWDTIQNILREKHTHLYEAFLEFTYGWEGKEIYNGVTKQELETFILTNFELVGEGKKLSSYLD